MSASDKDHLCEICGLLLSSARPEQMRAIESDDRVCVVSAGAGTGKTYTLSGRFARLLATDPTCRIDDILTLTYTQKAADEMRGRISSTLRSWHDSHPKELAHLADAINRISEAYISTIHSFAMRVIRESGLELDIDPSAEIASESVEREFWSMFEWDLRAGHTDKILARVGEDLRDETARVLEEALSGDMRGFFNEYDPKVIAVSAKDSCDLFGSMNMTPSALVSVYGAAHMQDTASRLLDGVSHKCESVVDLWRDKFVPEIEDAPPKDKNNKFYESCVEMISRWSNRDAVGRGAVDFVHDLFTDGPMKSLSSASIIKRIASSIGYEKLADWKNENKYLVDNISTLFQAISMSDDEVREMRALTVLAAAGWSSWENAKRERGMLSYSDLVRCAGAVLSRSTARAPRFRHILIDEFQDTDAAQDSMIASLSSGDCDADERGRTLFIVGDIKQSIYGFRNADPNIFARHIANAASDGSAASISMTCSSRMNSALIERLNRIFARLWRDGVVTLDDGTRIDIEPLVSPSSIGIESDRDAECPSDPIRMLVDVVPSDDGMEQEDQKIERKSLEERRASLFRKVIDELASFFDSGGKVWDKELRAWRSASWGDVAVLVPTRRYYPGIEDACAQKGVRATFSASKEYFNRGEVKDMAMFLRAMNDPHDARALASWIASPFSGSSPETAIELLSSVDGDGHKLFDAWGASCPDECRRFERLRSLAEVSSPSSAVMALLEDMSWIGAYHASTRLRVEANIRKGADILREYEASFGRSLAAEADLLEEALRGGTVAEEPDCVSIDGAIRVMTVHSSKGLEFPITVVFGIDACFRKDSGAVITSRHLGVIPSRSQITSDAGADGATKPYSVSRRLHDMIETPLLRAEFERLLYVAMTRACDLLILAGISKKETMEGEADSWLKMLLDNAESDIAIMAVSTDDDEETKVSRRVAPAEVEADKDIQERPRFRQPHDLVPRLARFSASAYSMISWCPAAYRARYRQGDELKWELPDGDGYGGADLGSLAHMLLRRWDLDKDSLDDMLMPDATSIETEREARMLPSYLRPVFCDASRRRVLYGWLRRFADTDVCAELKRARERGDLRRELWFSVDHRGVELAGSIDVFWEDAGGAHIRDWKITREAGAPDVMYRHQLEFYALAFHSLFEFRRVDTALIHLRPTDTVMREPERVEMFDEISERVAAMAELASSGPFEPRTSRCGICPFALNCAHRSLKTAEI